MSGAWYNEIDPFAADWLEALIEDGLIAPGVVDRRSIEDVHADDLRGYTQCHFFAGIGGWSYALRLAGWPDDRPVWTGSCPCQPFSSAGKQKGIDDERHLWPSFCRLIAECTPPVCVGEQVASRLGREWLAGVFADLEGLGYAVAGADLCAAGVGAPHIRQRLYWVADGAGEQRAGNTADHSEPGERTADRHAVDAEPGRCGGVRAGLANAECNGRGLDQSRRGSEPRTATGRAAQGDSGLADDSRIGRVQTRKRGSARELHGAAGNGGVRAGLADTELLGAGTGLDREQGQTRLGRRGSADDGAECERMGDAGEPGREGLSRHGDERDQPGRIGTPAGRHVAAAGAWSDCRLVACVEPTRGGGTRTVYRRAPVEPALFPLADGVPGRVGMLRGAGNAIVPQVAASFIRAYVNRKVSEHS